MTRKTLLLDTLFFITLGTTALLLNGCAVPLLLGVKEYPTENGPIRFITGADIMVGLNGVDAVENKRGISPKELR